MSTLNCNETHLLTNEFASRGYSLIRSIYVSRVNAYVVILHDHPRLPFVLENRVHVIADEFSAGMFALAYIILSVSFNNSRLLLYRMTRIRSIFHHCPSGLERSNDNLSAPSVSVTAKTSSPASRAVTPRGMTRPP